MSEMFGKTYIVKVLDDGECITEGELIRCKDCRHYQPSGTYCKYHNTAHMMPYDYCSEVERKEE